MVLLGAFYAPADAIRASTRLGAEHALVGDMVGTIDAGMVADLIAVTGDPLVDIGDSINIEMVMKAGEVVRGAF